MTVLLTVVAEVKDWQVLRALNRDVLLTRARELGATHYRLYRDALDASRALIIADLPDDEALRDLASGLDEQLRSPNKGEILVEGYWEPTDLEGIG